MNKNSNNKQANSNKLISQVNSDYFSLAVTDGTNTNYLAQMDDAIEQFASDMNAKMGNNSSTLFGYTDEIWHHGTFYIDAISKRTGESGTIPNANPFASADFSGNWGELYQLKNYRNPNASALAQSITYNQEYNKYIAELTKQGRPIISKEQYLIDRNIDPNTDMNLPIYEAQTRLIPTDQLQDAIKALKIKILSEPRTEQRYRYEDTLSKLVDRIKSPNGASSTPLSREDSMNLAKLAKEGKFDPKQYDITLAQKADKLYLIHNTLMSGVSAAVVTASLKVAPHIANIIINLIKRREFSEEDIKLIGEDFSDGAKSGFIRGTIISSIKNACSLGYLGQNLQKLSLDASNSAQFNSVIVVITTFIIESINDVVLLKKGTIDKSQFEYNLNSATL